MTRRARLLLLLGVTAGAACMKTGGPVSSGGTLEPGAARPPAADSSAFRVVFAGPVGEATAASELTLVFSRALRSLDVEAPPPSISIEPKLAGKWLWVGGRALRFVPEQASLPNASEFTVEVPASVTALDGARLGAPYRFSFQSPRPKLVQSEPPEGSEGLLPSQRFELFFNQAIDPTLIERHAKLTATNERGKASELPFQVQRSDPRSPKRATLIPSRPLPLASRVELSLDAGLTSEEGKLPAGAAQTFSVSTYGPLRVTSLECLQETQGAVCAPMSPLAVTLSNPVRVADFKRALKLTPALAVRWESYQGDDELLRWFTLRAPYRAASSVSVRVDGSLRDLHGQTLGAAFERSMRFGDHSPELAIGIEGEALEPSRAAAVPIGFRNVPRFELVKTSVAPNLLARATRGSPSETFELLRQAPGASYEQLTPGVAKNQFGKREIDVVSLLGGSGRGVFAIAARYPVEGGPRTEQRLVKLSDLALSAKLSRFGSLLWVTRLSTGAPVPGATVEYYPDQHVKRSFQADSSGLVHVPAADFAPDFEQDNGLFVARSGADWTFENVSSYFGPWQMSVPVDLSGRLDTYGMLFTERGVYRPGDELAVKGIVRDETPRGNSVPRGRSYELVLSDVEGNEVGKQTLVTGDFGTFNAKFKLPASAKLGSYRLSAKSQSKTGQLDSYFEVAEYRPAEFEVSAEPSERELVRGQKARFVVHGDYLYGAPMSGAKLSYFMAREVTSVAVPGFENQAIDARSYYADLPQEALDGGGLANGQGQLGSDGSFEIAQPLELPGQRHPERVLLSAEVTDQTRQAIGAEASVLVHPADFYVALKPPEDYFFTAPTTLRVETSAVSPKGERLAGKRVELELVKRRWALSRQELGDGDTHAVSRPIDDVVSRCSLNTTAAAASCELSAKEGGYYLVVARAQDGKKRAVEAALGLYGIGGGSFGWGDNDRATVELVPNKKQYRIGDTAQILIKSPFKQAEALVTVERAGVYHAERVKLTGATPTVSVKIGPELAPNAFVGVHLVVPRKPGKEQASGLSYRFGYAELPIDAEARRLRVTVKPLRAELQPGQQAEVELSVSDRAGKPAPSELTVYAVDEGVLMLTGYRTPDPVPVFGAARSLAVATLETRASLAKIKLADFDSLGEDKGADVGGGGFGDARRDFRQVALFEPKLVTDAQGKARVRFKLPDTLTSYRVMAVAVSKDDRYGFGDARVTASKPLMVRPALPRFLRAGDSFEAAAVIAAKGSAPGKVRVKLEVSGAAASGALERDIELGKDESKEVRFALRAERVGTLKIGFVASSPQARDAVRLERPIKVPGTLESVAVYGETKGSVREKLGDLSKLRSDSGGLSLALSSSALTGLDSGLEDLVEYPYGCTEQLTSRLLPLGPLKEMSQAFALPLPARPEQVRDRLVAQIVARQLGDGGFGMWPESRESSAWVTPWALWVLEETRRSGAVIPKAVFERGREYLRRWLSTESDRYPEIAAFAVDVLAVLGTPDHGYAEKLWKRRSELPVFSRGLLLHALVSAGAPATMTDALSRELENALRVSGNVARIVENTGDEYAALMDSPTRTTAIVLRGLLARKKDHPLAAQLARGLLQARTGGRWRSTQETAFSLLALEAYRKAQEPGSPDFRARATHGGAEVASLLAEGRGLFSRRGELGMSALVGKGNELLLEKDGDGSLFYEIRLKYAPRTLPSKAEDAGFFVKKTLRAVKPAELDAALRSVPDALTTRFAAGDLVIADLVLVAPTPSDYVVLDDPLPAGFEAIDSTLTTTASYLRGLEPEREADRDAVAHGRAYLDVWQRSELRDDRVLFFVDHLPAGMAHFRYLARATTLGSFVVPPTKAFEMYQPETYGRTAATLIEVR